MFSGCKVYTKSTSQLKERLSLQNRRELVFIDFGFSENFKGYMMMGTRIHVSMSASAEEYSIVCRSEYIVVFIYSLSVELSYMLRGKVHKVIIERQFLMNIRSSITAIIARLNIHSPNAI
jgi:hypothetical protein